MDTTDYKMLRVNIAKHAVQALADECAAALAKMDRLNGSDYDAMCQHMHETEQQLASAQAQIVALKIAGESLLDQIDRSNWVEQDTGFGHTLANNQRLYEFRNVLRGKEET